MFHSLILSCLTGRSQMHLPIPNRFNHPIVPLLFTAVIYSAFILFRLSYFSFDPSVFITQVLFFPMVSRLLWNTRSMPGWPMARSWQYWQIASGSKTGVFSGHFPTFIYLAPWSSSLRDQGQYKSLCSLLQSSYGDVSFCVNVFGHCFGSMDVFKLIREGFIQRAQVVFSC